MTESDLIRCAAAGQREAYGQIFKLYRDNAYGLAYQYTQNKEDALDVVQDAFIKAYQNLSRFDLKRAFRPWLMTIVRNQCLDFLRRRKRRRVEDLPLHLPDARALSRTERRVLRHEIRDAMSRLSEAQREIVFLKDYQGHSYAEIAEILDIPLGTVMSRLHHARKRMVGYLNGDRDAM